MWRKYRREECPASNHKVSLPLSSRFSTLVFQFQLYLFGNGVIVSNPDMLTKLLFERLYQLKHSISIISFPQISKYVHTDAKGVKGSKMIAYWNSQITKNGRNGNIKEAESIFSRMPRKTTVSWTAMLTAYAENGQIANARKMFEEMPERTTASFNAMISSSIRNGCNVHEAYRLFSMMHERNAVSYAAMITGFVRARLFREAEKLYFEAPLELRDPACSNALIIGFFKIDRINEALRVFVGMTERDVFSWTSMIDGLCRDGRIVDARNLFDRMPERNVVSWSAMIDGFMKKGCFKDGFDLFLNMRRENLVEVNSTTMTIMMKACGNCGRIREGMQIHGLASRMGFEFDDVLSNTIVTMYCTLGCMDMADRIFSSISKKDIVSWNSLISGYVHNDEIEAAYRLFRNMPEKDLISWTAMITGFCNNGRVRKAIELFEMSPEKDDIVWTAIISGFVKNAQYEKALHWYVQMLRGGCRPNPSTLSSVLSASAALVILNQGMQIHTDVLKMNLEYDLSVQNSLVSMYSKCGNVSAAYRIFTDIIEPNIVSFNSIITGFAQNGFGEEAIKIYKKMQCEGPEPNHVTFLAVLSACTHAGLVQEGWNYFNSMKSEYGIEPGPDHYACMVDLLGRAGLLDEAVDLIRSMPVKPHSGVWGAVLGASKTYSRLDIAKLAAQSIIEMEPSNANPYVVMSNLYSVSGKEVEGNQMRITKNLKGIKKSPGCSWITV